MKKFLAFIYLAFILVLIFYVGAIAQEQPKKEEAPPPPPAPVFPERSYELPYDLLWDKIIDVLKEKRLYNHPHGKAMEDKENGKITTPTFRYFSIIQAANPVIELDYTDQYIIMVIKPPEPKKEEPKAEPAKEAKEEAKADPAKEAKGEAAPANPATTEKKAEAPTEKPGQPAAEKAPPQPEPPKGPPIMKVQIQRKFLKHNGLPNPQGAWAAADPKQENNIGISEEDLFKELDLLIASLPKPAPATAVPATAPPLTTPAATGGK